MKSTLISAAVAVVLIGGAWYFTLNQNASVSGVAEANVSMVDGKQVIEITAKGSYQPRKSAAKAGIPTVLKFNTNGTFDCTSVVRIPSMNITQNLPPSGTTEIDLGTPSVAKLQGTCGMGMYPFEIDFQA